MSSQKIKIKRCKNYFSYSACIGSKTRPSLKLHCEHKSMKFYSNRLHFLHIQFKNNDNSDNSRINTLTSSCPRKYLETLFYQLTDHIIEHCPHLLPYITMGGYFLTLLQIFVYIYVTLKVQFIFSKLYVPRFS